MKYLSGFGAHHETEARKGALPVGRNSPQKVRFGLYAEQLSGTAFTAPRAANLRSWLYRLHPSAMHKPYRRIDDGLLRTAPCLEAECSPNRLRWKPQALPRKPTDFLAGLETMATCGDARAQRGASVHMYAANRSMKRAFHDADGELLVVPQQGTLTFITEFGVLEAAPGEIAVMPRGVKFRVDVKGPTRLREPRRCVPVARARAHRRQRACEPPRFPGTRGRVREGGTDGAGREVRRPPVVDEARALAVRRGRVARQLPSVQVRPRPLQRHQHRELRPSGSFDLHGAHVAFRHARHGERGFRDLPAALDRGR
jgi:hypothetical protein